MKIRTLEFFDGDIWSVADRYVRAGVKDMGDEVDEALIQGAITKVARVLQELRSAQKFVTMAGE